MAKITRKSYKRKKVVMGALIFGAIALISTGFAGWAISADALKDTQHNIHVGSVKNAQLKFHDVKSSETDFRFDVAADDNDGRIRFDPIEGTSEVLSTVITGFVTSVAYLDSVTITMEANAVMLEAETNGFITLPECANNPVEVSTVNYTLTEEDINNDLAKPVEQQIYKDLQKGDQIARFSYTVGFGWGNKFGNVNPCFYYDDPNGGGKKNSDTGEYMISAEEIMAVLGQFRDQLNETSFKITLEAKSNV